MAQVYSFEGRIPVIDPSAFVHPTAVLIGDVQVGPGCYVGPGVSLRGDFSSILLNAGCNVQDNAVLHGSPHMDTVVEEDGHIGHGAVVHACRIGRNALIGMNAIVFDDARIGESAIVAALSFVKARFVVPPRHLVAGVPARVVRPLDDAEIAKKRTGTIAYQRLAARCLATLEPCDPLPRPEHGRPRIDIRSFWPED